MNEINKVRVKPQMISEASTKRSRGGSFKDSTSSDIGGLLCNIKNGVSPFSQQNGDVSVRDAVLLCQKAYWNVAIFKLTIDVMTEFSNSKLHFKGKNKSSVEFYTEWYKKINKYNISDQFFRELFRSSNIFLYRVNGEIKGVKNKPFASVPIRYILLNPADICCESSASFSSSSYKKIINDYEAKMLKESKSEQNLELKKGLPEKVRKDIERGISTAIPLSPDNLNITFFKKQDYEPMAVPMYFPVLFDINLKLEFKKAEQLIARACEYMILLITVGDKDVGVDNELVQSITDLFQKESVGRVLVSDWTTKMDFVLPDLKKILGPEKYTAVNADIANGLMNIFFGEQKYADSMLKIKVFLERLKEARKLYLDSFLIPEMELVAKELGFREIPTPVFEEVDLKDEIEYMKLYNRLAELGFLTDEETISAYKTHILPEKYDSLISQQEFKKEKKSGLYEPIGQGQTNDEKVKKPAGRPTGTPQKQKQKKVTPVGGSVSFDSFKEVTHEANNLIDEVLDFYKTKFNISRASKNHKNMARNTAFYIVQNEPKENWKKSIAAYVENPTLVGEIFDKVLEISETHSIDLLGASLLFHSQNSQD